MFGRRGVLVFYILILFVGVRFWGLGRLVPESWTPQKEVILRFRPVEEVYQSGSKYIISWGRWVLVFSDWPGVERSECYEFQGKVKVEKKLGKQVKGVMYDPEVGESEECGGLGVLGRGRVVLVGLRERMVEVLQKSLPEPEASLGAGILLGVRGQMPEEFYEDLVETGTLHVIAASGYNTSIVLRVLMGVSLLFFSRGAGLLVGFLGVFVYVLLAGGSAAVVRAGVMGVLSYSAYFFGRVAEARRMLWLASLLILVASPLMVFDVGFQLSVGATAGILYFGDKIGGILRKLVPVLKKEPLERYLAETLYPTLAASITTLPIILWYFGRVSWISPLANFLVLGLVPLSMFLAAWVVFLGFLWLPLGQFVAWFLYVPLHLFVLIVEWLG